MEPCRPIYVALVALVTLAVALAAAGPSEASPLDTLVTRWNRILDQQHLPGMVVVLVRDTGIVRLETLGVRDVEHALPVTPATRFYIASTTKPIVATAAALLATEGRLNLDAPVRTYLPRFQVADPGLGDSITTRDLLCHRWGLVRPALSLGEAYTGQMTEERFYRLLSGVKPRRHSSYSNLHFTLTGRVIDQVAHGSWKRFLEDSLFAPAGMTRATCSATTLAADPDGARGYAFLNGALVRAEPAKVDATMHAAGGVAMSALDLARWLRLQLGDGMIDGRRVLPATALRTTRVALMFDVAERHPLIDAERRVAYSAGWEVRMLGRDTLYCHNGEFAGAASFMGYLPGRNIGVGVLINGSRPAVLVAEMVGAEALAGALGDSLADPLGRFSAIVARLGATQRPALSTGRLTHSARDYSGRYDNPDWGTLDVTVEGDSLTARIGALPIHVALAGDDRLGGEYPGAFELDDRGRVRAVWMRMAAADSVRFARR